MLLALPVDGVHLMPQFGGGHDDRQQQETNDEGTLDGACCVPALKQILEHARPQHAPRLLPC